MSAVTISFLATLQQIHIKIQAGAEQLKTCRGGFWKWELWGMYYLGMLPTADKRFYCTALREALNLFALKCFRNIWHWFVWPTVDTFVKPYGFVTRQHVSIHFLFFTRAYFSACLCFSHHSQPLILQSSEMTYNLQFTWPLPFAWRVNPRDFASKQTSVRFHANSRWISYLC